MEPIAKGVCSAFDVLGADCDWKATRATLIAIIAIAAVFVLTRLSTRHPAVRRAMDGLYTLGGIIAALFLLAMLAIIVLQMVARWSGQAFPGSTNYAGYCMAASSFFALAYTLNNGAHIRVNLLLNALGPNRFWAEVWCFGVGAILSTYFARYAIKTTIGSVKWNDISQGQDATPLWIPQIFMCIGTVLLAIAVWDNFFRLILTGESNIKSEGLSEEDELDLVMES